MRAVVEFIVTVVTAALVGGATGRAVSSQYVKRTVGDLRYVRTWSDPAEEHRIQAAARRWAKAHGRPGAERLVADKLRLGLQLRRRRSGRWSR